MIPTYILCLWTLAVATAEYETEYRELAMHMTHDRSTLDDQQSFNVSVRRSSVLHCTTACLDVGCMSFTRYKSEPSTCTLHFKDSSDSCSVVQHNNAMLYEKKSGPIFQATSPSGKDCQELYDLGHTTSGTYVISVNSAPISVYCDMNNGGWTVISNKACIDWTKKKWNDYKFGFGFLLKEHWLGLDNIHAITTQATYKMKLEMQDLSDNLVTATVNEFSVADESDKYRVTMIGFEGADVFDFTTHHNGQQFSTPDQDNDRWSEHCASKHKGAFWYNKCHYIKPLGQQCLTEYTSACMNYLTPSLSTRVLVKSSVMKVKRP